MFRSVWIQIHYGMDAICLDRTDSNLNSIISLITGWTVYTEKYKARGPDV